MPTNRSNFSLPIDKLEVLVLTRDLYTYYNNVLKRKIFVPLNLTSKMWEVGDYIDTTNLKPNKIKKLLNQGKRNIDLEKIPDQCLYMLAYIFLAKHGVENGVGSFISDDDLVDKIMAHQDLLAEELEKERIEAERNNIQVQNRDPRRKNNNKVVCGRLKKKHSREYITIYLRILFEDGFLILKNEGFRLHKMLLIPRRKLVGVRTRDGDMKERSYPFMINGLIGITRSIGKLRDTICSAEIIPESFFSDDSLIEFCRKTNSFINAVQNHCFIPWNKKNQKMRIRDTDYMFNVGALSYGELLRIGEYYGLNNSNTDKIVRQLIESNYLVVGKLEVPRDIPSRTFQGISNSFIHEAEKLYGCSEEGIEFRKRDIFDNEFRYLQDIKSAINSISDRPVAILPEELSDTMTKNEDDFEHNRAQMDITFAWFTKLLGIWLDRKTGTGEILKCEKLEISILGDTKPLILRSKRLMGEEAKDNFVFFFTKEQYDERKKVEIASHLDEVYERIGTEAIDVNKIEKEVFDLLDKEKLLVEDGKVYIKADVEKRFSELVSQVKTGLENEFSDTEFTTEEVRDTILKMEGFKKTSPPHFEDGFQHVRSNMLSDEDVKFKEALDLRGKIKYAIIQELKKVCTELIDEEWRKTKNRSDKKAYLKKKLPNTIDVKGNDFEELLNRVKQNVDCEIEIALFRNIFTELAQKDKYIKIKGGLKSITITQKFRDEIIIKVVQERKT